MCSVGLLVCWCVIPSVLDASQSVYVAPFGIYGDFSRGGSHGRKLPVLGIEYDDTGHKCDV